MVTEDQSELHLSVGSTGVPLVFHRKHVATLLMYRFSDIQIGLMVIHGTIHIRVSVGVPQ